MNAMSKKIKIRRPNMVFEMDYDAVRELMKSDEMVEVLQGFAEEKARDAGPGYTTNTYRSGKTRDNVSVILAPGTPEAEQDNYENNTLVKGIS